MQVPDLLYKYMTADTAKIVLETGRLRWQSPCQFNDVNELHILPSFDHPMALTLITYSH